MIMRFDYVPDRRRLVAATRRASRRAMLLTRSVGALAAVAAVVAVLLDDPAFAVGWAAIAVCGLWLFPLLSIRRAVRVSWHLFGTPGTWEISDDGIRRVTEKLDTLFRWEAVMDVELMPDQLLLRLNKAQFLPVTTVDLSAEQRDELISHLRGRGLVFRGERAKGGTPTRAAA
ncbi:YcxB family protein [Micromonospora sp. 4G57]|uniref:YcxB family protein n=1 Tax=Micromonospora sicca TaxID=2202420 RepID=A0ABU5JDM4_9ACTN|nr:MULTISPECIES: YcxB family protein [unclassified Micromonospora]MDZ5442573.1 YcxB family protein [Micromonospora sp. 4G57]MDZ5490675.1 YcxB family protein [Micromonospora sp. 4G53]